MGLVRGKAIIWKYVNYNLESIARGGKRGGKGSPSANHIDKEEKQKEEKSQSAAGHLILLTE